MKNSISVFVILLVPIFLSSCGGGGSHIIKPAKASFKAVPYPFENPESVADGKMVKISADAFIVISQYKGDETVGLAAYSGDSVDLLWRSTARFNSDEEVDYNSLFVSNGNLNLFSNRLSGDTTYYSVRSVDIKNGNAGEPRILIQKGPQEYACGLFQSEGGGFYGVRIHHRFGGENLKKDHDIFKTEFSPDSSKLFLFAAGTDAMEDVHKSPVSGHFLVLDRNLGVLKNNSTSFLLPSDSGFARGAAIDNSGNADIPICRKDGSQISVKQYALLGDGSARILRNIHPQNLKPDVEDNDKDQIGITVTPGGKVFVAKLYNPVKKAWNGIKQYEDGRIIVLSRFDFASNSVIGGCRFYNEDTAKKIFSTGMFGGPLINQVIADETLNRVLILTQETGSSTIKTNPNNNSAVQTGKFDYVTTGNILLSAHTFDCAPLWLAGVNDFETEIIFNRYMNMGYMLQVTPKRTLRLYHQRGFYLCDEFDMTSGARLTPVMPKDSEEPTGLAVLDMRGVGRFPWFGCRLSDNTEVFLTGMHSGGRERSIVKVMMPE